MYTKLSGIVWFSMAIIPVLVMLGCGGAVGTVAQQEASESGGKDAESAGKAGIRENATLSEEEAIESVRIMIRERGGDPSEATYSAILDEKLWRIMIWYIDEYDEFCRPLFVPGGHSEATVNQEGRVIEVIPGL